VIELGETVYDAARREVREECGIEIEVDRVIDVLDGITLDDKGLIRFHYVVIYVLARYVKGEAIPDSDASDVLWVKRKELGMLDMHPLIGRTAELAYETK
jgi:8-oxo-dGTP diphosphatase